MLETFKKLFEVIKCLIDTKYYGSFTLKFESGNIVQYKVDESIKDLDILLKYLKKGRG